MNSPGDPSPTRLCVALGPLGLALGALLLTAPPAPAQCWNERPKLHASNPEFGAHFGHAVAIEGETVVVGAIEGFGAVMASGAAYVYRRDQGGADQWGELLKLAPSSGAADDHFGESVAISGDTIAVGSRRADGNTVDSGAVFVFERDLGGPEQWGERLRITASDGAFLDAFGGAVSLDGNTLAVGARTDDTGATDTGSVYVFERHRGGTNAWGLTRKVLAGDRGAHDRFGWALALYGDTLVVGAYQEDAKGSNSGSLYVFERDAGGTDAWGQVRKLTASDGSGGDELGWSVALHGGTLVAGARGENANGSRAGAAYVFGRDVGGAGNWGQVRKLLPADGAPDEEFGYAVAVEEGRAIVGSPFRLHVPGPSNGSAYVFERDAGGPGQWGQVEKLLASDGQLDDNFGAAVDLWRDSLAVGALHDDDQNQSSGAAYVLDRAPAALSYCTAGTTSNGCRPSISAAGLASASAPSGFVVTVAQLEGNKQGILYFGTSGRVAVPWGAGTSLRCVKAPGSRTGNQFGGGTSGQCDGALTLDFNAWMTANPGRAPLPGTTVNMQGWFRDPPAAKTTNLSDALEFVVCP